VSPFTLRPSHLEMSDLTAANPSSMIDESPSQVNAETQGNVNSVPVAPPLQNVDSEISPLGHDSDVTDFVSKVVNTRHTDSGMEYLVQIGSDLSDQLWLPQEDVPSDVLERFRKLPRAQRRFLRA